jgi:hypothetical protein
MRIEESEVKSRELEAGSWELAAGNCRLRFL